MTAGGTPFASFINRNNAGGYLNLCLAAAVGLMIWVIGRRNGSAETKRTNDLNSHQRSTLQRRVSAAWYGALEFVANLNAKKLAALTLAACIAAGVVSSLSRGAWVAAAGASGVTIITAAAFSRSRVRLGLLAVALVATLGIVAVAGRSDAVRDRLGTMLNYKQQLSNDRLGHWQDGLRAASHFWTTGSGLGTYRYVYRMYEDGFDDSWFYHAENQYLEALVEAGIPGLTLMLAMIVLVSVSACRLLRDRSDSTNFAFGLAGVFAVSSQAIHAFFDFGLYLPSNMLLMAVLCGGVCGRAAGLRRSSSRRRRRVTAERQSGHQNEAGGTHRDAGFRRSPLTATIVAVIACGVLLGYVETRRAAAVESAVARSRFGNSPTTVVADQLQATIADLETALERYPGDARAQERLGNLWIQQYRLDKFEALRKRSGRRAGDAQMWSATSLASLHAQLQRLQSKKQTAAVQQIKFDPLVRSTLASANECFLTARRQCPLLPKVHVRLAGLAAIVDGPSKEKLHVDHALRLAGNDVRLLQVCGQIEAVSGRVERACAIWSRCIALAPGTLDGILRLAERHLDLTRYIDQILPNQPELFLRVAQEKFAGDQHAPLRRVLADKAEMLMTHQSIPSDERQHMAAALQVLRNDPSGAIESYKRALAMRPTETGWRYDLARLLTREGRLEEAQKEAQQCVHASPNDEQYAELLKEIIRVRIAKNRGQADRFELSPLDES